MPGSAKPSPGDLRPSVALPGKEKESLSDSLSVATLEASKPTKAVNGATANVEGLAKQPQVTQKAESGPPAKGPVGAPTETADAMQDNTGPATGRASFLSCP